MKGATQWPSVFLPLDSTAVLSDPSGSARSLHSSLSGSPSSHIEAVLSLLSPSFLVCRISVRVLVERDPGGRRFCPARRDLNPSRLPKYPMTVVFDTSADNPRAVLGQKRRYTLKSLLKKLAGGKNSEAQSGNGLEVAGCHVRGKPFRTLPLIHWNVFTSAQRIHCNIFAAIRYIFVPSSFFHVHSSASE